MLELALVDTHRGFATATDVCLDLLAVLGLCDDGTMTAEWGAIGIDDEGHPSRRNVLIQDGVLTDYMWDYLRARKEGRRQSGNGRRQSYQHLPMVRMTNTFVLNGPHDPAQIVRDTKNGVYVAKLGGGQVDTASGDFVFACAQVIPHVVGEHTVLNQHVALRWVTLIVDTDGTPLGGHRAVVDQRDEW
ncbi:MAG: metallopeptidase TldD-related protein [Actinomycetota bacterium]